MNKTRIWLICCLIGSLGGCASDPIQVPTWQNLEPASVSAQRPLERPDLPDPIDSTSETVTFDTDGFKTLLDIIDIGDGNYEIAQANADALNAQSSAYNALIDAGRLQEQFTQIREEQLQRERRDHFLDNWFHRGLIALGILISL